MNEEAVNDDEAVKFTLEDAYEHLKDLREELTQEMENLMDHALNNETVTISHGMRQDEINTRYHKLVQGLLKNFLQLEPRDLPIPNTIDLHKTMIQDIGEFLNEIHQVRHSIETNIALTKKNITYLESNKEGLETMKVACLGAVENIGSKIKQEDIEESKKLFHIAKNDLFTVVDTMFPDENGFKDVLAEITQAYSKGGDEIYINFESESLEFVKFLIEADVAAYHRNDKSKIRMTELL